MKASFNLVSIEVRKESLLSTLDSLKKQTVSCDINLYLNYPSVYNYGVNLFPFVGDLGDTGKFYSPSGDWNLFVDDDIVYPEDYAERLITTANKFKCPVGVHGAILSPKLENYFKNRIVFHFSNHHRGSFVNVLGTGTLCFHSDLGFSIKDIDRPNMSDCYFAAWCQERQIPLYCVPRSHGWLKETKHSDSLWSNRGSGEEQTNVIRRVKNWKVYKSLIT